MAEMGKELEAELSCLFAEAHFGSLWCLFIAAVSPIPSSV
jgi:hypothetical protein